MAGDRDRGSVMRLSQTSARLRAIGRQAQAQVYRASGKRPAQPRQPRRSRFTGRAAVLALVLCALVVALAYPTRQYIAQREKIADQRRQVEDAQKRVNKLREEKARWQDPAFVKAQARKHLHYVLPGEDGYTMLDPAQGSADGSPPPLGRSALGRPWYQNFWDGVEAADDPAHSPSVSR